MSSRILALLAASALFAPPTRAADFKIDPSHTSVVFGISHLGYSYTYGRFNKVAGSFSLDEADPTKSAFAMTIDAGSVDTNDAKRDQHLQGPDFLNSSQFPIISFKSAKVAVNKTDKGEIYVVEGNFTMHGETKPIKLELRKLGEGDTPFKDYRAGFLVRTELKRSDFGMKGMIPMVGDDVLITISFEGIRQ